MPGSHEVDLCASFAAKNCLGSTSLFPSLPPVKMNRFDYDRIETGNRKPESEPFYLTGGNRGRGGSIFEAGLTEATRGWHDQFLQTGLTRRHEDTKSNR